MRTRARGGPDRKRPVQGPGLGFGQVVEHLLLELEEPASMPVKTDACFRRLDATAGPVEQALADPVLEGANLQADGRLRHSQVLGGLGEAFAVDDLAESRELTRIHKDRLCLDDAFSRLVT